MWFVVHTPDRRWKVQNYDTLPGLDKFKLQDLYLWFIWVSITLATFVQFGKVTAKQMNATEKA